MKNNRRNFIKQSSAFAALSLAGLNSCKTEKSEDAGAADSLASEPFTRVERLREPLMEPFMKIAYQGKAEPEENDIKFIQQLGLDHVVLWTDGKKASYEYYNSRRELYEAAGIKVYGFGSYDVHNQDAIVLGLENKDAKIEEYKQHLRNLSKAKIPYTTYAHMANGIWSTERETIRGGAGARGFKLENAKVGTWIDKRYEGPLTHGRKYTTDELWGNYEYFIKQAAAVAEEQNIKIGIHPDDPPVPELGGIPRCIFSSFDGYKKALEIADSPNVGICLCVGCWLEGGKLMGKDVLETIEYFGKQKKLFKVHLRNVTQPLPHFTETFLDEGFADMYKILKALKKVDFDGVVIIDHVPSMVGGLTSSAYSVGYLKGLVERVFAEG